MSASVLTNLDRREFLKGLGAGLLICLTEGPALAQE